MTKESFINQVESFPGHGKIISRGSPDEELEPVWEIVQEEFPDAAKFLKMEWLRNARSKLPQILKLKQQIRDDFQENRRRFTKELEERMKNANLE